MRRHKKNFNYAQFLIIAKTTADITIIMGFFIIIFLLIKKLLF